ncbi:6-phosphogluconate dehydrogenase (decarboxylating) [Coriobacterium glomerans PW2]|uniref:6-phosphogluconate dehydrogenase (Decarboxylating) n=2 Tax=Coriobacterium TaxID=33870 RepID=F2NAU0_CORGP|nr:decarboxylating 6-phosphogluconate dehydrogenase [Coriobacterium glomerans]AEB07618.1 6-phosphogluconate dehydrogenase (decarboxylating) [Coriobacterium glomerans PW2]
MQIGLVGLGKMGYNLALNLCDHNHEVIGFDLAEQARARLADKGVDTVRSLTELAAALDAPRVMWLMVPPGDATDATITKCLEVLEPEDILIDAGNTNYRDTIDHAAACAAHNVRFLDIGTSGGTSGARQGACLMIGGDRDAYELIEDALLDVTCEDGCAYVGPAGSGHFMKMVHNGVEYGMMQTIGEGLAIMRTAPFDYDLAAVCKNWNHGSVVRSWLMELIEQQLIAEPDLAGIKGIIGTSDEAKWTMQAALEQNVPAPVIAQSLFERNSSQMGEENFSHKVVAALRKGFGGHAVVTK